MDKVNETALRFGDRIRFGKIEALFESDVSDQAQPLPEIREVEARPAESSVRPADFANASPFPNRKKDRIPRGKSSSPRRQSRFSRSSEA